MIILIVILTPLFISFLDFWTILERNIIVYKSFKWYDNGAIRQN
jgi:hypothetical protein